MASDLWPFKLLPPGSARRGVLASAAWEEAMGWHVIERCMFGRAEHRRCDQTGLLLGAPGAGKSMLARRLTTLLPALTLAEAIETTRLPRVAGRTGARTALVTPCSSAEGCTSPPLWGKTMAVLRQPSSAGGLRIILLLLHRPVGGILLVVPDARCGSHQQLAEGTC
jgi:hypothetical protein